MTNAALAMPRYFESGDVAQSLDCSASYVRVLVQQGRIKPVATTARGVQLFNPDDVHALAAERRTKREAR